MKTVLKLTLMTAIISFISTNAFAEKKVKWKLAMTWPSHLTPLASPAIKVGELVEQMSGGNFTIKPGAVPTGFGMGIDSLGI